MKSLLMIFFALFVPVVSAARDSTLAELYQTKIGIGLDAAAVTVGPHILYYDDGWLATFTFGLPTSNSSGGTIKEISHTLFVRAAYAFGAWWSSESFWPTYLGIGYTRVTEKHQVLGFQGNGTISGYSIFLGTRSFRHPVQFLSSVGGHFEVGYSSWNYTNSIIGKNTGGADYKYPQFFFSLGAYIYLK